MKCVCSSALYGSNICIFFGSYSLEPELAGATYAHRLSHKSFFCSVKFSSMHTAVRILLEMKEEAFWCISAAETVTGLLRTLEWSEAVITHSLSPPTLTVTLPYTEVCLNVLPWVCTAQRQLLQRFKGAHCVPEPLSTGSNIQTVKNSLLSFFLWPDVIPSASFCSYFSFEIIYRLNFGALLHLWPLSKETKQRTKEKKGNTVIIYSFIQHV